MAYRICLVKNGDLQYFQTRLIGCNLSLNILGAVDSNGDFQGFREIKIQLPGVSSDRSQSRYSAGTPVVAYDKDTDNGVIRIASPISESQLGHFKISRKIMSLSQAEVIGAGTSFYGKDISLAYFNRLSNIGLKGNSWYSVTGFVSQDLPDPKWGAWQSLTVHTVPDSPCASSPALVYNPLNGSGVVYGAWVLPSQQDVQKKMVIGMITEGMYRQSQSVENVYWESFPIDDRVTTRDRPNFILDPSTKTKLHFFFRGYNESLYYFWVSLDGQGRPNTDANGKAQANDLTELPGTSGRLKLLPSPVVFNGRFYVFYHDQDNKVQYVHGTVGGSDWKVGRDLNMTVHGEEFHSKFGQTRSLGGVSACVVPDPFAGSADETLARL